MRRFFGYFLPSAVVVVALVLFAATSPRVLEVFSDSGSSYAAYRLGQYYNNREDQTVYDPDLALDWFEIAAEAGNVDALYEIGELHLYGDVKHSSREKAYQSFADAAGAGNEAAMGMQAILVASGVGAKKDVLAGEALYLELAKRGLESSELNLALLYVQEPQGFSANKVSQALRTVRDYASEGNPYATIALGEAYIAGEAVPKDPEKGIAILHQAIDKIPIATRTAIGRYHYLGRGGKVDYESAFEYFSEAAALGSGMDQYYLGQMFEFGLSVEQDHVKAADYYRKAIKNGFHEALLALGGLHLNRAGVPKDFKEAHRLFQAAVDMGVSSGPANIGWMLVHGWGVQENRGKGLKLIEDAAEQKDFYGCYFMAALLEEGASVEKNLPRAMELYKISADQGNQQAKAALIRLSKSQ